MIEIIRKGPIEPVNQQWEVDCDCCGSRLRYWNSDVSIIKSNYDPEKHGYLPYPDLKKLFCPACGYTNTLNRMSPMTVDKSDSQHL